jgi:predicted neutral ceramidase superfamily lipid hydrolase
VRNVVEILVVPLVIVAAAYVFVAAIKRLQKAVMGRKIRNFLERERIVDQVQTLTLVYNGKTGKHRYEALVCFNDEADVAYTVVFNPFSPDPIMTACKDGVPIFDGKYLVYGRRDKPDLLVIERRLKKT